VCGGGGGGGGVGLWGRGGVWGLGGGGSGHVAVRVCRGEADETRTPVITIQYTFTITHI
jgi:hypothetical protein